jgi:hypothetical protein
VLREDRDRETGIERLRLGESKDDRVRVGRLHTRQVDEPLGVLAQVLSVDQVEGELHVVRAERLAVVPPDTGAQAIRDVQPVA